MGKQIYNAWSAKKHDANPHMRSDYSIVLQYSQFCTISIGYILVGLYIYIKVYLTLS